MWELGELPSPGCEYRLGRCSNCMPRYATSCAALWLLLEQNLGHGGRKGHSAFGDMDCRAHCRSLLPHSSNTALQPRPWGWCRLTVDGWGASFISIIWCDSCSSVSCSGEEVEQQHSALWGQLLIEPHSCKEKSTAFSVQRLSCPLIHMTEPRKQLKKLGRSLVSLALLLHGNELQGNKVHFTYTGCFLQLVARALGQRSSNLSHHSRPLIPTFFCSVSLYAFSQWKCRSLYCEFNSTDHRFVCIRRSLHWGLTARHKHWSRPSIKVWARLLAVPPSIPISFQRKPRHARKEGAMWTL